MLFCSCNNDSNVIELQKIIVNHNYSTVDTIYVYRVKDNVTGIIKCVYSHGKFKVGDKIIDYY